MTIRDQIVQIAVNYSNQNITEIPENDGWTDPQYEADMLGVGWSKGDEWCAAAAILDWKKAYVNNPVVWQHASQLVSLNSQQMGRNFRADPKWPTSENVPKLGAIAIWQFGNSATEGHCGIVVGINGNQFTSVEGNTTSRVKPNPNPNASEREGWTVAEHVHTIGLPHSADNLNLVRFIYAIESYKPLVVL